MTQQPFQPWPSRGSDRWRLIAGPKWFTTFMVSTVAISGAIVTRAFTLDRIFTLYLALALLVINVFILVRHIWWVYDIIGDHAYSRGQNDGLERESVSDKLAEKSIEMIEGENESG